MSDRQAITPPGYAKRLGVKPETVLAYIRSGELRAINVASRGSSRPRWRIYEADIEVFENRREAVAPPKVVRRRKKRTDVIQFF